MNDRLFGQARETPHKLPATSFVAGSADDIQLEGIEAYYCLFEIPMKTALEMLPLSLHPSLPAHLNMTFWRCRGGAIGAFELCFIGISCRAGIKPRHLVFSSFADTQAARDFFRDRYGFPCERADVQMRERYDSIKGKVAIDGRTILEVITAGIQPIIGAGAFVKYTPALNMTQFENAPWLVQLEASYDFKRVLRGRPRIVEFDGAALHVSNLRPALPMAGSHAQFNVTLHPVRFLVNPTIPAEDGGTRKLL